MVLSNLCKYECYARCASGQQKECSITKVRNHGERSVPGSRTNRNRYAFPGLRKSFRARFAEVVQCSVHHVRIIEFRHIARIFS